MRTGFDQPRLFQFVLEIFESWVFFWLDIVAIIKGISIILSVSPINLSVTISDRSRAKFSNFFVG